LEQAKEKPILRHAQTLLSLAATRCDQGQTDAGLQRLRQATPILETQLPADHWLRAQLVVESARCQSAGSVGSADRLLRTAAARLAQIRGSEDWLALRGHLWRASTAEETASLRSQ
jgi:hypothetical protein